MGDVELVVLCEVLVLGWIIIGLKNQVFEVVFCQLIGNCYVIVVSLVIGGMYVILMVLGIGFGDEVIMLFQIWVFIFNMICLLGVMLVMIDVDNDNLMIIFVVVEVVIILCIKVIIFVYYVGVLVDIDVICVVGECYGILVIEDVVYVVGIYYKGCYVGWQGIVIFLFYVIKNMICVEGGLIVIDDDELVFCICSLKFYGLGVDVYDCQIYGCVLQVEVIILGFKYNFVDINVVLVLVQLEKLSYVNQCWIEIVQCYLCELVDMLFKLLSVLIWDYQYVWYLFIICVDEVVCGISCDVLMEKLKVMGIGIGLYFCVVYM